MRDDCKGPRSLLPQTTPAELKLNVTFWLFPNPDWAETDQPGKLTPPEIVLAVALWVAHVAPLSRAVQDALNSTCVAAPYRMITMST